ncbi:hypothetical protein U1Q18_005371 [Sarracenia purpurea var. burkii]
MQQLRIQKSKASSNKGLYAEGEKECYRCGCAEDNGDRIELAVEVSVVPSRLVLCIGVDVVSGQRRWCCARDWWCADDGGVGVMTALGLGPLKARFEWKHKNFSLS